MSEPETAEDRPALLTLSPPAARKARKAAQRLGTSVPEVVRGGLGLVELVLSLREDEYLAVRRANGKLDRVMWPEVRDPVAATDPSR